MSEEKKKPSPNPKKSREKGAINIKQNESDGRDINYQEKQKQEKHQPRDTA